MQHAPSHLYSLSPVRSIWADDVPFVSRASQAAINITKMLLYIYTSAAVAVLLSNTMHYISISVQQCSFSQSVREIATHLCACGNFFVCRCHCASPRCFRSPPAPGMHTARWKGMWGRNIAAVAAGPEKTSVVARRERFSMGCNWRKRYLCVVGWERNAAGTCATQPAEGRWKIIFIVIAYSTTATRYIGYAEMNSSLFCMAGFDSERWKLHDVVEIFECAPAAFHTWL